MSLGGAGARFLLTFEASGDQEVAAKIKEVGTAGKETAADLEALQGIEDPFAPIATGAQDAIGPIGEVGSAAQETIGPLTDIGSAAETAEAPLTTMGSATEELGGIFTGAGTEAETFGGALGSMNESASAVEGGLTGANTVVGEFGDTANTAGAETMGMGEAAGTVAGTVAALGGTIGSTVSSLFRYQDAQLRVQKAQLMAARAAEIYRKSEEGIDAILATATGNADGIAAARQRLSEAQAKVNQLMNEGVTSGEEYEAAQAELQAAQKALGQEFVKGGGDLTKLNAAMEKSELAAGKVATTTLTLEKAQRQANQTILDLAFGFAGLGGSMVQTITGMDKVKDAFGTMGAKLGKIPFPFAIGGFGKLGIILAVVTAAIVLFLATYDKIRPALVATAEAIGGAAKGFEDLMNGVKKFIENIRPMEEQQKAWNKEMGVGETAAGGLGVATNKLSGNSKTLWGDILALAGVTKEEAGEFMGASEAAGTAGAAIETLSASEQNAMNATNGLTGMFGKFTSGVDTANQVVIRAGGAFVQLGGAVKDLGNGYSSINGTIVKNTDILGEQGLSLTKNAQETAKFKAAWDTWVSAAGNYVGVLEEARNALEEDTAEKERNAATTLELLNTQENAANAIATVNEAWAQSRDRLADLNTVLNNSEAAHKAVQTAVNETTAGLIEEAIQLEAASQSADSAAQAQLRLDNAHKAGVVSIKEWVSGLAEAEAEQQGQIQQLGEYGHTFEQLPNFIDPTIENLKKFAEAARMGGQAAVEMGQATLDAFADMTSTASSDLQGLVDVIRAGGEDINENIQKWWEKIPEGVRENMSEAQKQIASGLANAMAAGQNVIDSFQWDLTTGMSFEDAAARMEEGFRKAAEGVEGVMKEVFTKAADIAATGSDDMIKQMNDAFASGVTGQPLLDQLNTIFQQGTQIAGQGGSEAGAAFGQGFTGNAIIDANTMVNNSGLNELPPMAGETGTQAAISLSEHFAAAGTHIAAVISGINANLATIVVPTINISPLTTAFNAASNSALTLRNNVVAATNGIATGVAKAGAAAGTFATKATGAFNSSGRSALTMRNNVNAAGSGIASAMSKASSAAASASSRIVSSFNRIGSSATSNASKVRSLASAINSLKSKTVTITTRYRTIGSPVRRAQTGMHETLAQDTMIQAHAGERVDIGPRGGGSHTVMVPGGSGGSGGGRDVNAVIPVYLDGKVITRIVRRHLIEDATGAM